MSNQITVKISKGKLVVDSATGDGKCHGVSAEFIENLRRKGLKINVTNTENTGGDEDGIPVSVHC